MSGAGQLVLIDGSGYIFRAFHALPPMTRGDGTPVNAVYGFTSMVTPPRTSCIRSLSDETITVSMPAASPSAA